MHSESYASRELPYQQNSQSHRHRLKTIKQVNKYGNNFSLLCCEVAHCSIISSEKLNNLFGFMNVKENVTCW